MAELDFEAPFAEGLKRLDELRAYRGDPGKEREAAALKAKLDAGRREVYANLTSWQRTLVARHPNRPYTLDYIGALVTDFVEVKGDRRFADDPAIVSRLRSFRRPPGLPDRSPEGPRHEAEDLSELRHAQTRGLSQGHAGHAHGREVRPAHRYLRGHAGRLSRSRRRGTRSGRGHRLQPARDGEADGSGDCHSWSAKAAAAARSPSRWGIG